MRNSNVGSASRPTIIEHNGLFSAALCNEPGLIKILLNQVISVEKHKITPE